MDNIKDKKEEKTTTKLDELFKNFDGDIIEDWKVEIEWDEPQGKEVW